MQRTPSIESGARSGPGRKGNVVSVGKRSGRVRRMFKFSPVGRSVGPGWHLVRAAESASNCFLGTISEQRSHSGTAICGNRPTGRAVYARPSLADGKTRRTAPGFSRRLQQAWRGLLLSFSLCLWLCSLALLSQPLPFSLLPSGFLLHFVPFPVLFLTPALSRFFCFTQCCFLQPPLYRLILPFPIIPLFSLFALSVSLSRSLLLFLACSSSFSWSLLLVPAFLSLALPVSFSSRSSFLLSASSLYTSYIFSPQSLAHFCCF